jgi:hypothetical protein
MKKSINLLEASKKPGEKPEYQSFIQVGTIILIIVYILVILGTFSFYFFLSSKERRTAEAIVQKEKEIQRKTKIESLQLTVKTRLKGLIWIFDKEEGKIGISDSLRRLKNLSGEKVTISSVEISRFGNSAVLSGSVPQVTDLINFFAKLIKTKQEAGGFDDLSVSSLTKGEKEYRFSIALGIS